MRPNKLLARRRIVGLALGLALAAAVAVGIVVIRDDPSKTIASIAQLRPAYNAAPPAKSCGKKIITDWWPDGRIDGRYGLECYGAAWGLLPVDGPPTTALVHQITRAYKVQARAMAAASGESGRPAVTASKHLVPNRLAA